MAKAGVIAASDLELAYATDSIEEAIAYIREKPLRRSGFAWFTGSDRKAFGCENTD